MKSLHLIVILALFRYSIQFCEDRLPNTFTVPLQENEQEFPLKEFLKAVGINSEISWYGHQCKKQIRMLGGEDCSCSSGCKARGECCIDYLWQELAFNNKSMDKNILEYEIKVLSDAKRHECLPFFPFDKDLEEQYIMVTSCSPNLLNLTDIDKCLNSHTNSREDQMPVFGNDDEYLYKNQFCARCNNVYSYRYDTIELYCNEIPKNPEDSIYNILKISRNCKTSPITNKQFYIKKCQEPLCNPKDATLCSLFKADFYTEDHGTHKNVFCAKCGNVISGTVKPICFDNGYPGGWSKTISIKEYEEKTCLITEYRNSKGACERKTCGGIFKLDEKTGKCQKVLCPPDSIVNAKKECEIKTCPQGFELTLLFVCEMKICNPGYRKNPLTLECVPIGCRSPLEKYCFSCDPRTNSSCQMRMDSEKPTLPPQVLKISQSINCLKNFYRSYALFAVFHLDKVPIDRENLTKDFSGMFVIVKGNWTVTYQNKDILVLKRHQFVPIDTNVSIDLLSETTLNKLLDSFTITEDKKTFTKLYGFDLTRIYASSYKVCGSVENIKMKNFQNSCQSRIDTLKDKFNGSTEPMNFIITLKNGTESRALYYCNQFHLHSSCHREVIEPKHFQVGQNNALLIYKDANNYTLTKSYRIDEYLPTKRGFEVCAQSEKGETNRQTFPWMSTVVRAEYYISLIGSLLSLVCYVLVIFAFAVVPVLRNTGGLYVLVLVVFLLISDLVFIINTSLTPETAVCKWFGILLYWFLLTVCFWCGVVAVDLTLKFTKAMDISSSAKQKEMLQKRLVFTSLASLIITTIMVCLEETGTSKFNLEKKCWIDDFNMSLVFYFIPVIVGYVLCFVCLCVVFGSIKRKQNESNSVLGNRSNKNTVPLKSAIKLFIILGITEAFGLIQIRKSDISESERITNAAFAIVYDTIRSLRGVFIFIVYILNEKTLKLIRNSFGKNDSPYELSKTKSTSVSA